MADLNKQNVERIILVGVLKGCSSTLVSLIFVVIALRFYLFLNYNVKAIIFYELAK